MARTAQAASVSEWFVVSGAPADRIPRSPEEEQKTLSARCGSSFRIDLWEDRTRGELWVPTYDSATLVLVDEDFHRVATGNAADLGRRSFEFRTVTPGTHRLLFEKRLGWKFTAEDRRVFLIDVAEGNPSPHPDGL